MLLGRGALTSGPEVDGTWLVSLKLVVVVNSLGLQNFHNLGGYDTAEHESQGVLYRVDCLLGPLCKQDCLLGILDEQHKPLGTLCRRHNLLGTLCRQHNSLGFLCDQHVPLCILWQTYLCFHLAQGLGFLWHMYLCCQGRDGSVDFRWACFCRQALGLFVHADFRLVALKFHASDRFLDFRSA